VKWVPCCAYCVVLLDGWVSEWFVTVESDSNGSFITVECGSVSGQL